MSNSKKKERLHLRRQLIFRHAVLDNRPLSLKQVRELLGVNYDEETAQRDIDAFKEVGCLLKCQPSQFDPLDREIVFLEGPHTDDDTVRENINVKEKQLVARLAVSLICGVQQDTEQSGLPPWMQGTSARQALDDIIEHVSNKKHTRTRIRKLIEQLDQRKNADGQGFPLARAEEILKLLSRCSALLGRQQEGIKQSLINFWDETNRLVAIDSGTTNIHVSRYLRKVHIPLLGSTLCSLTVCTNSRRIFEVLGPSDVWVKTIILGGQQMFRTPTIAGAMAEIFLRSVATLRFGVCILGATRVDLDRFEVCSDSQQESSIKSLLMDRSSLRVICVDHSKFKSGPGRAGYRYASIDPKHIHLMLTNCPFRSGKNATADYRTFIENVQRIEARGVPVLVATSPKTFHYPSAPTVRGKGRQREQRIPERPDTSHAEATSILSG